MQEGHDNRHVPPSVCARGKGQTQDFAGAARKIEISSMGVESMVYVSGETFKTRE